MAKKNAVKLSKLPKWTWWLLPLLLIVVLLYIPLRGLMTNQIVRIGNPLDSSAKEVVLQSCGSRLPTYKYSIDLPANWTIIRSSYDEASTYFEARGIGSLFTISCTNQGVGGGCEEQYRTQFNVSGKTYQACFGKIDGKLQLSDFSLSTDPVTNATISFWSKGLDRSFIERILATNKIIGNQ